MVADLFRSRAALETEIWMLRQQVNVLRRTAPKKQTFSSIDRLIFVCLWKASEILEEKLANELHLPVIGWLQLFTSSRGMARSNFKRAFRAAAANLPLLNVRQDKRGNQEQIQIAYDASSKDLSV
jgi:hypothetical protein